MKCIECKFWKARKSVKLGYDHVCANPHVVTADPISGAAADPIASEHSIFLYTGPDFGCVHYAQGYKGKGKMFVGHTKDDLKYIGCADSAELKIDESSD